MALAIGPATLRHTRTHRLTGISPLGIDPMRALLLGLKYFVVHGKGPQRSQVLRYHKCDDKMR